jgi:DNA invertase Pin-like site-specific DNA recombinase
LVLLPEEETKMPRLAIYARVSTQEQHVEPQLHGLRSYAEARGLEVAGEYLDEGISGAKDRRPALDRLLSDARRRTFDVVACVKLDRLARSVHHLTSLAREFQALGIDLVVLDQAIDTSTPAGRLLFHVLGSIAEFERDLIRERTVAGMTSAKRRGARVGRPRTVLSRSQLMAAVQAGASLAEVARLLGTSRATARRLLAEAGLSERVSRADLVTP